MPPKKARKCPRYRYAAEAQFLTRLETICGESLYNLDEAIQRFGDKTWLHNTASKQFVTPWELWTDVVSEAAPENVPKCQLGVSREFFAKVQPPKQDRPRDKRRSRKSSDSQQKHAKGGENEKKTKSKARGKRRKKTKADDESDVSANEDLSGDDDFTRADRRFPMEEEFMEYITPIIGRKFSRVDEAVAFCRKSENIIAIALERGMTVRRYALAELIMRTHPDKVPGCTPGDPKGLWDVVQHFSGLTAHRLTVIAEMELRNDSSHKTTLNSSSASNDVNEEVNQQGSEPVSAGNAPPETFSQCFGRNESSITLSASLPNAENVVEHNPPLKLQTVTLMSSQFLVSGVACCNTDHMRSFGDEVRGPVLYSTLTLPRPLTARTLNFSDSEPLTSEQEVSPVNIGCALHTSTIITTGAPPTPAKSFTASEMVDEISNLDAYVGDDVVEFLLRRLKAMYSLMPFAWMSPVEVIGALATGEHEVFNNTAATKIIAVVPNSVESSARVFHYAALLVDVKNKEALYMDSISSKNYCLHTAEQLVSALSSAFNCDHIPIIQQACPRQSGPHCAFYSTLFLFGMLQNVKPLWVTNAIAVSFRLHVANFLLSNKHEDTFDWFEDSDAFPHCGDECVGESQTESQETVLPGQPETQSQGVEATCGTAEFNTACVADKGDYAHFRGPPGITGVTGKVKTQSRRYEAYMLGLPEEEWPEFTPPASPRSSTEVPAPDYDIGNHCVESFDANTYRDLDVLKMFHGKSSPWKPSGIRTQTKRYEDWVLQRPEEEWRSESETSEPSLISGCAGEKTPVKLCCRSRATLHGGLSPIRATDNKKRKRNGCGGPSYSTLQRLKRLKAESSRKKYDNYKAKRQGNPQPPDGNSKADTCRSPKNQFSTKQATAQPFRVKFGAICKHCGLKITADESEWCCAGGTKIIRPLDIPGELLELAKDPSWSLHSRKINLTFSLGALTTKTADNVAGMFEYPAPSNIVVNGMLYARCVAASKPSNGSWWFVHEGGSIDSALSRLRKNAEYVKLSELCQKVEKLLRCHHKLMKEFKKPLKTKKEWIIDVGKVKDTMFLVWRGDGLLPPERAALVLRASDGKQDMIGELDDRWEPLLYPVFFPTGQTGWGPAFRSLDGLRKITLADYARATVLREPILHYSGRLLNQYVLDIHSREEASRFQYYRTHQSILRVSDEYLNHEEKDKVILPSTHPGSRKYQTRLMHEGLALVAKFGYPDFFITMTCNPDWKDIKENLLPGQMASDRPDVVCRVFHAKVLQLLKDMKDGVFFGSPAVYYCGSIEFQKRGLPHLHLAVRTQHKELESEAERAAFVDQYISAVIPEDTDDALVVETFMIHRCKRPNCTTESCSGKFPKHVRASTWFDSAGYPMYKRGYADTFVVPHNLEMLKKFDCHINVEYAAGVNSIGYLYAYITKGLDRANVKISSGNEIADFCKVRYVSATEATWKAVFQYRSNMRSPSVKSFYVFFRPGSAAPPPQTDVAKYFSRPSGDRFETLTMVQYFERYIATKDKPRKREVEVWLDLQGNWVHSRTEAFVGRLVWIDPRAGEAYFLRALVQKLPARNYTELKNGKATFRESCVAYGFVTDDTEWYLAFKEAVDTLNTAKMLRKLFITCCIFGTGALRIFEDFNRNMSSDVIKKGQVLECSVDEIETYRRQKLLLELRTSLRGHGRTLSEFGLPEPSAEEVTDTVVSEQSIRFPPSGQAAMFTAMVCQLNDEQKSIFDTVREALEASTPLIILLQAPAGTGKSFLLKCLSSMVRSKGQICCVCASSGIAAKQLPGGQTAHMLFMLPIETEVLPGQKLTSKLLEKINRGEVDGAASEHIELLRSARLFIWDEVTMVKRQVIEAVDKLLRLIKSSDRPFGGSVFMLSGDVRQIPPIVPEGRGADLLDACLPMSPLFASVNVKKLTKSQRQSEDTTFFEWLNCLGGSSADVSDTAVITPINGISVFYNDDQAMKWMSIENFPDENRVFLACRNKDVDAMNDKCIANLFPGKVMRTYLSVDTTHDGSIGDESSDLVEVNQETLNKIRRGGVPPHKLELCNGMKVIVLRNLSPENGIVNGSTGVITRLSDRLVYVLFGKEIFPLPRINFTIALGSTGLQVSRRQFPIQPAYALTVHKSQGQTLDRVCYTASSVIKLLHFYCMCPAFQRFVECIIQALFNMMVLVLGTLVPSSFFMSFVWFSVG